MFEDKREQVMSFKVSHKEKDKIIQEARNQGYTPDRSTIENKVNISGFARGVVLDAVAGHDNSGTVNVKGIKPFVQSLTDAYLKMRPIVIYISSMREDLRNILKEYKRFPRRRIQEPEGIYLGKLENKFDEVRAVQDDILKAQEALSKSLFELRGEV